MLFISWRNVICSISAPNTIPHFLFRSHFARSALFYSIFTIISLPFAMILSFILLFLNWLARISLWNEYFFQLLIDILREYEFRHVLSVNYIDVVCGFHPTSLQMDLVELFSLLLFLCSFFLLPFVWSRSDKMWEQNRCFFCTSNSYVSVSSSSSSTSMSFLVTHHSYSKSIKLFMHFNCGTIRSKKTFLRSFFDLVGFDFHLFVTWKIQFFEKYLLFLIRV